MPAGRPPEPVPQDKADSVIEWIASGKTLREWSRQPGNVTYAAVYDWAEKDEVFATRLARAREIGQDVIAEECVDIMDDGNNDYMETKFGPQLNAEHVQRSKLRVWGRLELLKCWNPKKYGNRTTLAGDRDNPLIPDLDDSQRAAKIAAILSAGQARKSDAS
jgi:hypothetical protein